MYHLRIDCPLTSHDHSREPSEAQHPFFLTIGPFILCLWLGGGTVQAELQVMGLWTKRILFSFS